MATAVKSTSLWSESLTTHRATVNAKVTMLFNPMKTITFTYDKQTGILEDILQQSDGRMVLSADEQFTYGVATIDVTDIELQAFKTYAKYKPARSVMMFDGEHIHTYSLVVEVHGYDKYNAENDSYEFLSADKNKIKISYNIIDQYGNTQPIENTTHIWKNMGDVNKENNMLINGEATRRIETDNPELPSEFEVTVNDFAQDNVVGIKVKKVGTLKIWLHHYVALKVFNY